MAFTLRTSNENGNGASGTQVTVSVSGVVAGDFVVACGANASSVDLSSISDGTSSFTLRPSNSGGTLRCQSAYLLSSSASGSLTYTFTWASACVAREAHVYVFNPGGGTQAYDTESNGTYVPSGTSINTGNIATASTDEAVVAFCYHNAAETASSKLINGVAADGTLDPGGSMSSWYKIFASTFSGGGGTGTLATGTEMLANLIAIKNSSAAGPSSRPNLMLLGVG